MTSATETGRVRAEAKWVRMSARKARLVLEHIRGRTVPEARTILAFSPRAAAVDIEKVLRSAVANADEGPTLKRWRARARGRVNRIRKRTCHITVILEQAPESREPRKRRAAKDESSGAQPETARPRRARKEKEVAA